MSRIVTVKLHVLVLPEASTAVHITGVTPFGKVEPLGGLQATVTPVQLSLAVALQVTLLLEHRPEWVLATMLLGHMIEGGVVSRTRMTKVPLWAA